MKVLSASPSEGSRLGDIGATTASNKDGQQPISGSNLNFRPRSAITDADARDQRRAPWKRRESITWPFHVVTFYWAAPAPSVPQHFRLQSLPSRNQSRSR